MLFKGYVAMTTRTEGVTMALTDPASTHRLISISKAADLLGFDPKSIRRFIAAGDLPAYRVGRKHIRVEEADVLALIHRIPTTDHA